MALELVYIAHMHLLEALEEASGPCLSDEDKHRRDKRIPRISIQRYSESPFFYLFGSGNDQALLNCCAVAGGTLLGGLFLGDRHLFKLYKYE